MINNNLKILLLEDSPDDASLIEYQLVKGGIACEILVVDKREDFINGISQYRPDVIISDHSLPQFNSAEALRIYKQFSLSQDFIAPFILVTGSMSEEFAVQCIKDGADDYILKDRLQRLPSAVLNALEKIRIETENKRSAEERSLLLERYEYVTKATSDAIWDWDIPHNHVYCGEGFEKLFGHVRDPHTDNYNLNTAFISPDDIKRVMESIDKALESTNDTWQDEYKYMKANGDLAFVQDKAIIIRNTSGKAIRMVGAIQDITRKKKEDLRLKLLESVITHATDAVMIVEAGNKRLIDQQIVYVNDAFTAMTGYTAQEAQQQTPAMLHCRNADNEAIDEMENAFRQAKPVLLELICNKKNNESFWLNTTVSPVMDDKGNITHSVFIQRDISQQKRHIQEIEEQNIQLKEIAWIQSHIVRAPLAKMMGFINLIEKSDDEKVNKDLLKYVLDASKELDGIIRDIVAKSESIKQ